MEDSNGTNRRTVLRTIGSLGIAGTFVSSASAEAESESANADSDCSSRVGRPGRYDGSNRLERLDRTAIGDRPDRSPRQSTEARARALANRPGRYLAVVDRIVDGRHAVLLLEDDGDVVDQLVVSPDELPDVEGGDVLLVTLADDELESVRRLDGETERRRRANRERFDSLSKDCC